MHSFISPSGNAEVWEAKPDGYLTPDVWLTTQPSPPLPSLVEIKAAKQAEIFSSFNTAMSASLTMPTVGTQPSSFEVATALFDWRTEDPEGYAALLAIHTSRRNALLAAVEAAQTAVEVQAVVVSYAV